MLILISILMESSREKLVSRVSLWAMHNGEHDSYRAESNFTCDDRSRLLKRECFFFFPGFVLKDINFKVPSLANKRDSAALLIVYVCTGG